MQSVGDQVTQLVANLERDHLATLMKVDELSADRDSLKHQSDALASANAMLEKQLADRTSALADTEKRMDEALAQVEVVANAALQMLKTVRGQRASLEAVGGITKATNPLWKNAASLKEFTAKDVKMLDLAPLQDCVAFMKGDISGPAQKAGIIKEAEAVLADATQQDTAAIVDDVAIDPSFGEQVAGDIMAADDKIVGDSGDEMVDLSPIKQALEEKLVPPEPDADLVRAALAQREVDNTGDYIPLAPTIAPPIELDAVDRMRRSSADLLPAPSLSGSTGPVLVVRNEPLPIFLARDTVFGRNDPRL